jgi:hypothetical protein
MEKKTQSKSSLLLTLIAFKQVIETVESHIHNYVMSENSKRILTTLKEIFFHQKRPAP